MARISLPPSTRYLADYATASDVKANFVQDLNSKPGQALASDMWILKLPRFEDVGSEFLALCTKLGRTPNPTGENTLFSPMPRLLLKKLGPFAGSVSGISIFRRGRRARSYTGARALPQPFSSCNDRRNVGAHLNVTLRGWSRGCRTRECKRTQRGAEGPKKT